MARKGSATANPPTRLDESTTKIEKDSIAAAFDATPVVTGPLSTPKSTKHDPTAPSAEAGKVLPLENYPKFAEAVDPSELLPTFQKVFYTPISEADLAQKARQAGALTKQRDETKLAKKKADDAFTADINKFQEGIDSLMKEINSGGHEQELECRKRINYETSEATIFDANTLKVLEVRKLNDKERQVEMNWAGKLPPGRNGDTIGGAGKPDIFKPRKDDKSGEASKATTDKPSADGGTSPQNSAPPPEGGKGKDDGFTTPTEELGKQVGRGKKGKEK